MNFFGGGGYVDVDVSEYMTHLQYTHPPPNLPQTPTQTPTQSGYRYYKLIKYEHWAIGQTFLRKMYLVIDRAGRRVGFAPPIPGCAPPLPAARGGGGGGRA